MELLGLEHGDEGIVTFSGWGVTTPGIAYDREDYEYDMVPDSLRDGLQLFACNLRLATQHGELITKGDGQPVPRNVDLDVFIHQALIEAGPIHRATLHQVLTCSNGYVTIDRLPQTRITALKKEGGKEFEIALPAMAS